MKVFLGSGENAERVIVSLCDYSGNWPQPFNVMGHTVVCIDLKHGDDVLDIDGTVESIISVTDSVQGFVFGMMMAPLCTDFSVSGAQYWPAKDADGRTAASLAVVDACLTIRDQLKPEWWVLENPVGRLRKLRADALGPVRLMFNPCDYAGFANNPDQDRYTKKTLLWGHFVVPSTAKMEPIRVCKQGSWLQKLGGKSERTKELRSMTPMGFARAFAMANSWDAYWKVYGGDQ